jgi:outer membrane protein
MRNLLLISLIVICGDLFPQNTFSLNELITLTLEENYQLQIVTNRQEMQENMNTPGNAGMLPSVDAGAVYSRDIQNSESNFFTGETRKGTNVQSNRFNAFVELDWTVFDGFSMFARRDRLEYLAALGDLETRYYIEQTVADLARAYYALVRDRRLLDIYLQSKEVSAFRLTLEERKRSLGSGNALLYHQAVVDFNTDSIAVLDQQMILRDRQIEINRIINRDPRLAVIPVASPAILQGIASEQEIISMAVANNRDLERAKLEELIAGAGLRIEQGYRYPQVDIFGNYAFTRQRNELGLLESAQSYGAQFGIRVRINLYDGGRQNTRVRNAMLEQENTEIFSEDTQAYIEAEMVRLTAWYHALTEQNRLVRDNVAAAEKSLAIAREQFQQGAINGYEFRQTQLAVLQVENRLIQIEYAARIIELDIYRISGILLEKLLAEE